MLVDQETLPHQMSRVQIQSRVTEEADEAVEKDEAVDQSDRAEEHKRHDPLLHFQLHLLSFTK